MPSTLFNRTPHRLLPSLWLVSVVALGWGDFAARGADLVPVPALGLRIPRGFRATLFADANLANDITAITFDVRGDVVVSGPGYVRTLLDRNGDGVADDAVELAQTPTGGMGLCFDGNDLMFVGDGALWRFSDIEGDGEFDGPPQRLFSLNFAEHGGHAVHQGPDGWWYLMGGNDTRFTNEHNTLPSSPVRAIEAGALLRFRAEGGGVEAIAHGFRNAYDFDFNADGDLFTYDSDAERDYFLPWHTPTRLFHIAPGGHHGWRLNGWTRSWARPAYSPDTVDIMALMGRGSPTGVTCYRHRAFPDFYHNGLFYLDWTFGRVYFTPLQPEGSSYRAEPEVFIEPIGTQGFAPTGIAVGPDGSLFVSIGGRKTRGGVYRIQYAAEPQRVFLATNWTTFITSEAEGVLQSPQPLAVWSRAYWMPLAARLGPEPFDDHAADNRLPAETRVRAIEVLTEMHGGLTTGTAETCARATAPIVRARAAWSLGRIPCRNFGPILFGLARDVSPHVRCQALEAIRAHAGEFDNTFLQQTLGANLAHPDKRVRQVAALLALRLPEPAWKALWNQQRTALTQSRLTTILASLWRNSPTAPATNAIDLALSVLVPSAPTEQRLQAIRLIILALGDYHLHSPSVEVFTGYEPALPLDEGAKPLALRIRKAAGAVFPSGNAALDFEAARLLAMVEADDPALPGKLLALCGGGSLASADFHFLTVLARLKAPLPTNNTAKIAGALLGMDRKLDGLERRSRDNWSARLAEVTAALQRRDPLLADALVRHPDFARPGHLALVPGLGSERFMLCARRFLEAVKRDGSFPWSGDLIELLSSLPGEETLPLFRQHWANAALRDRLLLELARNPAVLDREKFVAGLSSTRLETVRAALSALLRLPREDSTRTWPPALRTLRSLLDQPAEQATRAQIVTFLSQQTGQPFKVQETTDLKRAYQPLFDWFNQRHPAVVRQLDANDAEDPARWNVFYKSVPWDKGDAGRGEAIFTERGCLTCHAGASPLGPDLAGVAGRLSPADLGNAIIFPSRDVAAPYRLTTFRTRDGQSITGMIAFESADGVIVRTGAATTVRLADTDILSREASTLSLMPGGLLTGLPAQGFADLRAYLLSATGK